VTAVLFKIYFFVANAFISPFNTQTMHIKSFYTQHHCYVFLITLYPVVVRTRVFLFLRRVRCPLCHAARAATTFLHRKKSFCANQFFFRGRLFFYNIVTSITKLMYADATYIDSKQTKWTFSSVQDSNFNCF
jgi:hypothetical protein